MLTVVWSGVDWFEFSCRGRLADGVADDLAVLKADSQTLDVPQLWYAPLPLYVSRQGAKPWKWVLNADEFQLRLSDSPKVPAASVKLGATGLAAYGHEGLYRLSLDVLGGFGELAPSVTSRLDLAVDFQSWEPTDAEMRNNIVCRAAYHGTHGHYRRDETFQFGEGALVVRIYNKTKELKKSRKVWLADAWARCPDYDPARDVWRFEAQLRREGLQSFGVKHPDDALDSLPALLGSMLKWCSLRVPQGKNQTRWPVDPRWEALAEAAFAGESLPRVHEQKRLADYQRTIAQIAGHLLSAAAARRIFDPDELWPLVREDVDRYVGRKDATFQQLARDRLAERTG